MRWSPLLSFFVFILSFIVFLPALEGEFLNWDDSILLLGNGFYRGLGLAHLAWMFSTTLMGHYMPLTWLTFGLNHITGGMDPWGYHLTNLILHSLNGALVYLLARRLLEAAASGEARPGPRPPRTVVAAGAALAALLFAIHPQRAESVGWVTDRGTVLSAFFYLLAVLGYLRAVDPGRGIRWRWAGLLSVLAFAAALLSKGITMTLPISLLVLDVYPLRRRGLGWPRLLAEKVPYAALAVLGAAVALVARVQGAEISHYDSYDLSGRLALAAYSLWFYPSRLLWPTGLSPLYEHPLDAGILEWRFLGPALAVVVVTGALALVRRRFPGGLAAWIHSAVVVAPVSGIVHSGSQLVSDRYGYLAGLGFVTLIGYGLIWTLDLYQQGRVRRWILCSVVTGLTLIVVTLGVMARIQVHLWHDSEILWRWAVDRDPTCALCQAALGAAILQASNGQRADEAEPHLHRAIALRHSLALAHNALGTIATDRGRDREAEAELRTYMRLSPRAADGPERLALLFLAEGRPGDAIPLLGRAQALRREGASGPPAPTGPVERLPERDGDSRAFREGEFRQAVDMIGNNVQMLQYLGQLLVQRGRGGEAAEVLRRVVARMPAEPLPRFWLVRAYRLAGEWERAEQEAAALQALHPALAELARSPGRP